MQSSNTVPDAPQPERVPIYVASRASIPGRGQMWRKFRDEGVAITSSWIDEDGEGETQDFGDLWKRITDEIRASNALVLYAETSDFPLKGAFIEAGIALGMGKPVIACLPYVTLEHRSYRPIGSWIKHPLVIHENNIREAVRMAQVVRADIAAGSQVNADDGEHCKKCGEPVAKTAVTWWYAPDYLWRKVYNTKGGNDGIKRCIPCFTRDCVALGIAVHWEAAIDLKPLDVGAFLEDADNRYWPHTSVWHPDSEITVTAKHLRDLEDRAKGAEYNEGCVIADLQQAQERIAELERKPAARSEGEAVQGWYCPNCHHAHAPEVKTCPVRAADDRTWGDGDVLALEQASSPVDILLCTGNDDGAWGEIKNSDAELIAHAPDDLRRFDALVTEQAETIERLQAEQDLIDGRCSVCVARSGSPNDYYEDYIRTLGELESLRSEANREPNVARLAEKIWDLFRDYHHDGGGVPTQEEVEQLIYKAIRDPKRVNAVEVVERKRDELSPAGAKVCNEILAELKSQ